MSDGDIAKLLSSYENGLELIFVTYKGFDVVTFSQNRPVSVVFLT